MRRNPFRKGTPAQQTYRFESSYPHRPVRVTVRFTEPSLSDAHVRVLLSEQRQEERAEAARQEDPAKYVGFEAPTVKKTIGILRKYVENAIAEDRRGKIINANGKTFTLSFGPRGEALRDLFEAIGFIYKESSEPGAVAAGSTQPVACAWLPPSPCGSCTAPIDDPPLKYLDDVSWELFALQLSRPESEVGLYASERFEWASAHINRVLDVSLQTPRDQTWSWLAVAPEYGWSADFRSYYDLGVIRAANPADIVEAYRRQCVCDSDPGRRRHYLRCLQRIGQGAPHTQDATAIREALQQEYNNGKYTDDDLAAAYRSFGFDSYDQATPSVESIVSIYKQKLRDNPETLDPLRACLLQIADYKDSAELKTVAHAAFPTYVQALQYFGIEGGLDDGFIISIYTTKIADDSSFEGRERAREALQVIAEARASPMLAHFLSTGEITESEMDVSKALALLQSPAEADDAAIMAAYHSCCYEDPERVSEFQKALEVISAERGRDVRNSETDAKACDADVTAATRQTAVRRGPDTPVGLNNIGNTCYLNSLLQFYFTVTPFRQMILNYPDYFTDLEPGSINVKKVGMRFVLPAEVVR
ncbi:ubiquitin-specific protease ubp2, partial [Ascosphaera acerosa]